MESLSDNILLEKIRVCVSYDLIGNGRLIRYEDMSISQKVMFTKQCDRLYDTCLSREQDYAYISERYDDIIQNINTDV